MHDARQRSFEAFVLAETGVTTTFAVPEIRLRLATDATGIYQRASKLEGYGLPPYWAFAWPGGQALARYILDWPSIVAGKRILDIGSGSAIQAIAALKAGAGSVLAADIDPLAEIAIRHNAGLNGVDLATTTRDLLSEPPDADLVLIGDLVYEPELEIRVGAFLDMVERRGICVLMGDRTTARRPPQAFEMLGEYVAPCTPALLEGFVERARVWRLG